MENLDLLLLSLRNFKSNRYSGYTTLDFYQHGPYIGVDLGNHQRSNHGDGIGRQYHREVEDKVQ